MKKEMSALLDGELEPHELQAVLAALKRDESLREAWREYRLIGDALRREPALSSDIADRVVAGLREVPTVLAPRSPSRFSWRQPALALAASAAGVAVVAWLALGPGLGSQVAPQWAGAGQPGVKAGSVATPMQLVSRDNMQEYLMAHQTHASRLHLQGGTQHVRTISVVGPVAGMPVK